LHRHVPMNLGSGERALSLDDIAAKFRANAALRLPAERVEAILQGFLMADDATPVRELSRLLG